MLVACPIRVIGANGVTRVAIFTDEVRLTLKLNAFAPHKILVVRRCLLGELCPPTSLMLAPSSASETHQAHPVGPICVILALGQLKVKLSEAP